MVTLAHSKAKYPNLEVEQDPFTDLPKDDAVLMDTNIPFDDSLHPPLPSA